MPGPISCLIRRTCKQDTQVPQFGGDLSVGMNSPIDGSETLLKSPLIVQYSIIRTFCQSHLRRTWRDWWICHRHGKARKIKRLPHFQDYNASSNEDSKDDLFGPTLNIVILTLSQPGFYSPLQSLVRMHLFNCTFTSTSIFQAWLALAGPSSAQFYIRLANRHKSHLVQLFDL